MQKNQSAMPETAGGGFFGWVERYGNKVPHPVYLFIWFFAITVGLSALLHSIGVQAVNPASQKVVTVTNLLTAAKIGEYAVNIVKEFVNFPPLGMVLVITLGIGVANGSGLLQACLKLAGIAKSKVTVTAVVMLIGINGNLAGDAAFVIYPPLVALLFQGLGRNPIAGLFAGYASVSCGFGANLLVCSADASLAGMTEAAARIVDPKFVGSAAMAWYFMFASTLVLTPVATWVNLYLIEPKLDRMGIGVGANAGIGFSEIGDINLSSAEKRALRLAGLSLLGYVVFLAVMTLPGLPFAAPKGGSIVTGPLLKSVPPILMFLFLIPGYMYGTVIGKIKNFTDAIKMMATELKGLTGFLVICFFAAQFIAVFRDSNIGLIIAIYGGNWLKNLGMQGPFLLAGFILFVGFVNLFIGSANAKWALLSTVFVPMLMIADINPAAIQASYRMGDSITKNLCPTLPYMAILLTYAQQYDPKAKTGTVLAYMIPYTVVFTIAWIAFFMIWLYLGLPLGPGYYGLGTH
ncbi:MAG: putative p-aminobenzoyl-glutamate transporter [Firmicutes bacterium]|nr:putative p-aminobenzoyl-glutamate transporter [Bacillota bacterium]